MSRGPRKNFAPLRLRKIQTTAGSALRYENLEVRIENAELMTDSRQKTKVAKAENLRCALLKARLRYAPKVGTAPGYARRDSVKLRKASLRFEAKHFTEHIRN
jgi:hypothetical protein